MTKIEPTKAYVYQPGMPKTHKGDERIFAVSGPYSWLGDATIKGLTRTEAHAVAAALNEIRARKDTE